VVRNVPIEGLGSVYKLHPIFLGVIV